MGTLWIAVDESGNLGFNFSKKGTRNFLVIAFVFTRDYYNVRKKMKRLRKKLIKDRLWPPEIQELKFSVSKVKALERGVRQYYVDRLMENLRQIRMEVLQTISKLNVVAAVSIVDKRMASQELRGVPSELYNYVLVHPLVTRFLKKYNPEPFSDVRVVLDKRLGSRAMKSFKEYLNNKYSFMLDTSRVNYYVRINPSQVNSMDEPLIWVADYIAGATFTLVEHGERTYVDKISNILFDCAYFWEGPRKCYELLGLR